MIKPEISEEQVGWVIDCLTGETLVDLLRSSIEHQDFRTLTVMENRGILLSAHLSRDHLAHSHEERQHRPACLDPCLSPMLDALAAVIFSPSHLTRRPSKKSNRPFHFSLDEEMTRWMSRQVDNNLSDLEGAIRRSDLPQPGHEGPANLVRKHLAGLGVLAVACNQPDPIRRIQRIDPEAMFQSLKCRNFFDGHSPWGFAFSWMKEAAILGAYRQEHLNAPVATNAWSDGSEDHILPERIIQSIDSDNEADRAVALWFVDQMVQSPSPQDGSAHPSSDLVERICRGSWTDIAELIFDRVPDFFSINKKDCLENLVVENHDLLRKLLLTRIDWEAEQLNWARSDKSAMGLRELPLDHPLSVVVYCQKTVDFTSLAMDDNKGAQELDDATLLVIQVMQEKGHLQQLFDPEMSMFDGCLNVAQEWIAKDLYRSLDFALRQGLDGHGLLEFCDNVEQNNATAILRAHVAAQVMSTIGADTQAQKNAALPRTMGN
jgi:hypothetical protein